jgi:hypothetical protein
MRSTRRKRLFLGAVFLRMPKGLAKIGEIGEAPGRQTCRASPVITGLQTRRLAGFAFVGSGAAPRVTDAERAADSAHPASLLQDK